MCFALSPNEQLLAVANKNFLIRVHQLPKSALDFGSLEEVQLFRTTNQMVLELTFDPSSKFLAVGTADSSIKIFDVRKGF